MMKQKESRSKERKRNKEHATDQANELLPKQIAKVLRHTFCWKLSGFDLSKSGKRPERNT